MNKWWESDPVVAENSTSFPTLPDSRGDAREARDDAGAYRDQTRTDIAVRQEGRDVDKTAFNQKDTLATRYSNEPTVKSYRVAVQELSKAIKTGDGPQADLALTYAFAKAMDPDSVVREAEQGMITNSQPWFQSAVENTKKQFGMDGVGNYTPEARKAIRAQIASAVAERNKLYRARREYYQEIAKRNGFDPYEVIGDHDGKPFMPDFEAYDARNKQDGAQTSSPPSVQSNGLDITGGVPTGSDITWNGPGDTEFDRNAWVKQSYGWEPNQEALALGWLNANTDKKLTPEQIAAGFASVGAPAPDFVVQDVAKKLGNGGEWTAFKPQEQIDWENQVERLKKERNTFGGEADAAVRGAADTATVGLADKGSALLNTIFDGGTYQENVNNERAINAADAGVNPYARLGGQLAGAVAVPYGAGAKTPAELAKVGAAYGGAYEFNRSDEPFANRLDNVAFGAATGAAGGYAGGKASNVIASKFPAKAAASEASDFVQAAERQNIDYLPADIPGNTGTKIATGITKQSLGGPLITKGADKATASIENAVARNVDNLGGAADPAGAGQAVQRGVKQWQTAADEKVNDLYSKIPIPDQAPVAPSETIAALKQINNPTASNPALSQELADKTLQRYQSALEGGNLSWKDLKAFRSFIGEKAGRPTFQQDISKDALDNLYGALSRDIEVAATAHSPDALKAFQRANNFKRGVETRRENVMQMLLGKDLNMNAEKAFDQIQRWGAKKGGDFAKLSQAIRSLPEDEAGVVRATVLDRLGLANKGRQNATGDEFSIDTLVTNWNGLSDRAKAVLFQGEHRKAVDDIMTAASGMKASARYNNSSNTGAVVVGTSSLSSFFAGPVTGALTLGGQGFAGLILGSPRAAKWMAALIKKPNPQAAKAHIMRLDSLAKSEPFIGAEVIQMKDYLLKKLAETPQQAAAEDQKQSPQSSATTNTPEAVQ